MLLTQLHQLLKYRLISTRIIQHRLRKDFGLSSFRPAKKPLLSSKNIRDRISFCKKVKSWTPEMWSRVLFSDETLIRQFDSRGSNTIRRPTGQRYNPRFVIPTVKHSSSVMVWGCFSMSGRGSLWFLPKNTTMNADRYREVLEDRFETMMGTGIRETSIFMRAVSSCKVCEDMVKFEGN